MDNFNLESIELNSESCRIALSKEGLKFFKIFNSTELEKFNISWEELYVIVREYYYRNSVSED